MIEKRTITSRAEWLQWRSQDLTASDIGAIIGVDPFKTPFEIWAWKSNLASPPEENAAMTLGRWCEPAVVAAHRELYPQIEIQYPLGFYLHDSDRLGATPDATGFDRRRPDNLIAFEFKVISRQSYERWWTSGPPLSYQLQTLCNALLLDAHHGILAAIVLSYQSAELVVHEVRRHAGAEARIREVARRFWQAFDEGHAPMPDYERDGEVISRLFRPDPAKPAPIDLTGDNRIGFLVQEWERLSAQESAAKKAKEAVKNEVLVKLAGAEAAIADGWKITNVMQHRAEKLQPAADFPRLLITRMKEKAA